jgi:hypothetical protein
MSSQKALKMSWNKASGLARRGLKPRDGHKTLDSVVQHMLDEIHNDAANRDGVLDEEGGEYLDSAHLSSGRAVSGAGGAPLGLTMGIGTGDSRANSIASVGSAAGEGGLLGRKDITGMLPPMPAYRDDTAKGRITPSMMPVEEGLEEGNSAAAVRCYFSTCLHA